MVRVRIGGDEVDLSWEDWEDRVRDGRIPPDALVSIDEITGAGFVPAGDLESYTTLRNEAALDWRAALGRYGPPPILTALLVGFQIRLWWWARIPSIGAWMSDRLVDYAPSVWENRETYRLVTMGVLQIETLHLALNMLWLAYTGWSLERSLGRANLAVLFYGSVVAGACASVLGSPWTPSLGSSGGVFGLIAAVVVFGLRHPDLLPARARQTYGWAMLPYLVLMFWSGFSGDRTDNWCHAGGLVTGAVLGFLLDPEPIQRRPGWNRLARGVIVTATLVPIFGAAAFGPWLDPLVTADEADRRLAELQGAPTLGDEGDEAAPEPAPAPPKTLEWYVPVGWTRDSGLGGKTGFGSPVGDRMWGVEETKHDVPVVPEDELRSLATSLTTSWPDATVGASEPADVAGVPGWHVVAEIPSKAVRVETWLAARGTWSLVETWEVADADATRLAPLRDRLRAAVSWPEPEVLAKARASGEPLSREGRLSLAGGLAENGDGQGAARLYRAVLADQPDDAEAWVGLLQTLRWYPDAGDLVAAWGEALDKAPDPRVIAEIAHGMDASGRQEQAIGLLDVAWARLPGDRTLRAARRQRGLPIDLDPDQHLPWDVVHDPLTNAPRPPDAVQARVQAPLTLDGAAERGRARTAERAGYAKLAIAALDAGDADRAVPPLLALAWGRQPADLAKARQGLAEDVHTLTTGGDVPWMPPDVATAVKAAFEKDPALAARIGGTP